MLSERRVRDLIESVVGRPVVAVEKAVWGFTNQTDIIELAGGDRVVLQRYGRREDAEYRVRVMDALLQPAAESAITIPQVRAADLAAEPPWIIFDAIPGIPVPAADEVGLGGPKFPAMARQMGELLARLRSLPAEGVELNDLWSDPSRLGQEAARWIEAIP